MTLYTFYRPMEKLTPMLRAWTTNKEYAKEFDKQREKLCLIEKEISKKEFLSIKEQNGSLEIIKRAFKTYEDGICQKMNVLCTEHEYSNFTTVVDLFPFFLLKDQAEIPIEIFKKSFGKSLNEVYLYEEMINFDSFYQCVGTSEDHVKYMKKAYPNELNLFIELYIRENPKYIRCLMKYSEGCIIY